MRLRLLVRPTAAGLMLAAGMCFTFEICFAGDSPAASNPAIALLNAGRVDEVISSLQKQNTAEAHILMGRAYYAEDKTDEAIKEGEKAVEMSPNESAYHLWLGRFYGQKAEKVNVMRQAGLAGKVRGEFEKAVALDANNLEARSDLAEYYVDAPGFMGGGTDKAKAQAEAVAQKYPAVASFIRAKIAEKGKDFDGAEKDYKSAIAASKTPAEQWLNLAGFYKERKNSAAMIEAVKKAIATPHKSNTVLSDAADLL